MHITQCLIPTLRSEEQINIVKNVSGHLCPLLFLKLSCTARRGHRLPVAENCISIYRHLCSVPLICLCRKTLGIFCILCKDFQNKGRGLYMYLHTHPRGRLDGDIAAQTLGYSCHSDLLLHSILLSTYACRFVFWTFSL